jgi:putative DNA primase/helicase
MLGLSLRALAHALGGQVTAGQVVAPGPGHSRRDRSLTVRPSASAPDGFLVFSHAGDDFARCKDYVRERLGLVTGVRQNDRPDAAALPVASVGSTTKAEALALWESASNPRGTLAERYFSNRGLELDDHVAGDVIRWSTRVGAVVALFRSISDGEPQAVSRTFLDYEGRKLERKFLGPVGAAAIMLDSFDAVTDGLHIGEGAETCLAACQLGLRPTWALGSSGAIAAFPVLAGVESLTILAEHDDASANAVEACAQRWYNAGREVLINRPIGGKDLNDAIRGAA